MGSTLRRNRLNHVERRTHSPPIFTLKKLVPELRPGRLPQIRRVGVIAPPLTVGASDHHPPSSPPAFAP